MKLIQNELIYRFKKKTTWLLFALLTVGIVVCAYQSIQSERLFINNTYIEGKEAIRYKEQKTKSIEGSVDTAVIRAVLEQLYIQNQQTPLSLDEMINNLMEGDMLVYSPYTDLVSEIIKNDHEPYGTTYEHLYTLGSSAYDVYDEWKIKVINNNQSLLSSQKKDLNKRLQEFQLPFTFESNKSISIMISKLQDVMLILYVCVAIFFATSFSKDRLTKSDQIIRVSTYGRKQLHRARVYSACLLSTLLYIWTIIVYIGVIVLQVGIEGLQENIQMGLYALSPYEFTNIQAFIYMLMLAYVMHMMITMLILYISCRSNKAYIVILVTFLFLFISYMVVQTTSFDSIYKYILMIFPFGNIEKSTIFTYCNVVVGPFSIWYPALISSLLIICMILLVRNIIKRGSHYALSI